MWSPSSRIYLDLFAERIPKLACGTFGLNLDAFASHVMNSSPKDVAVRKRIRSRNFLRQFSRTTTSSLSFLSFSPRCSLGSRQTHFANSAIEVDVPIAFFCSYAAVIFLCNDYYSQSKFAVFDLFINCDIFNYFYLYFFLNSIDTYPFFFLKFRRFIPLYLSFIVIFGIVKL